MIDGVVISPRRIIPDERGKVVHKDAHALVKVPVQVWNGFKGVGTVPAVVANCASIPHDPTEIERLDPFDPKIPYDWSLKHR